MAVEIGPPTIEAGTRVALSLLRLHRGLPESALRLEVEEILSPVADDPAILYAVVDRLTLLGRGILEQLAEQGGFDPLEFLDTIAAEVER